VTVICYLRNPADWLEANYKERVTGGWRRETRTIGEFLSIEGGYFLRHDTRLQFWADLFGRENVRLRSYEAATSSASGLYRDFLETAGLGHLAASARDAPRSNVSVGREETEMLRFFNRCNWEDEDYRERFAEFFHMLKSSGLATGSRHSYLSFSARKKITNQWMPVYERLKSTFGLSDEEWAGTLVPASEKEDWAPLNDLPVEWFDLLFQLNRNERAVKRSEKVVEPSEGARAEIKPKPNKRRGAKLMRSVNKRVAKVSDKIAYIRKSIGLL